MATLWLIGMMGAGKTTVGKMVAEAAGVPFVDLDDSVEAESGMPIPQIFADHGEDHFRRLEGDAVARVAGTRVVVSTGGGVVTRQAAVERMRGTGVVVWLDAPPETLAERVGDGFYRPMLAGGDPAAAVKKLARQRSAAYADAAHHRVETDGKTPAACSEEVTVLWMSS